MNKPKLSLETLWIQEQPGPFAVLAVSPNRTAVAFLEKMLRPLAGRNRVEMTQARSVSEAVNELDLGPFHLCLFDVDLGEAAILRWLKTIQAHENKLPVILLTTPDQEEVTVRGLLEGARDYLFKSSLAPEVLLRSMHYSLEREREDQALQRALRLSRRFFLQSPVGTFRLSSEGELLDCNATFAQILGYETTEQAVAEGALHLYYSDESADRQLDWLLGLTVLADNRVCLRKDDDSPVWVQMRIWTAEGIDGQRDQIEGAVMDLSPMEHLKDELDSTQAELRTVLELMGEGALFADRRGRVQACNRKAETMLGYETKDLLGHLLTEAPLQTRPFMTSPKDARLLSLEELQPGQVLKAKVLCTCEGDSVRTFDLRARLVTRIDTSGEPRIVVLLNKTEDTPDEASDNRSGPVITVDREGERATGVRDLNQVVDGLRVSLGHLLGEKTTLEAKLTSDKLLVSIERDSLERVITNLALNAKDALPDGGRISLATERIDVNSFDDTPEKRLAPGKYALLKIRDFGIGMDEATRSRIFEPFFTTKTPGRGTGLGLSTVRDIVRRSKGWISVVSAPGRGTTVRVWLPLV